MIEPSGHVVIVTGANHGIGAETALALAKRGEAVLVSYYRLDDPADSGIPQRYREQRALDASNTLDRIAEVGGRAAALEADLTDAESPTHIFDVAEAEFGTVDILVNNATGWLADTFAGQQEDRAGRTVEPVAATTIDRQFGVDVRGGALLISEFARRHREARAGWGRIVGRTSGGRNRFPKEVSYGAAKAALENYTMSAAFELAALGITANMVYPPPTDTGWVTDEVRAEIEARRDLFRIAAPADVAAVIAWLASDDASLVTGTSCICARGLAAPRGANGSGDQAPSPGTRSTHGPRTERAALAQESPVKPGRSASASRLSPRAMIATGWLTVGRRLGMVAVDLFIVWVALYLAALPIVVLDPPLDRPGIAGKVGPRRPLAVNKD